MIRINNPISDTLIYKEQLPNFVCNDNYKIGASSRYCMYSTKTGELLGKMITTPSQIDNQPSLYIDELQIFQKNQGLGSRFIRFAEYLSETSSMEGRIHLHAEKNRDEKRYPHLFYRKQGFKTKSRFKNCIFDFCILLGISQCKLFSGTTKMFK